MKKQIFKWIFVLVLFISFAFTAALFSVTVATYKGEPHKHDSLTSVSFKGQYYADNENPVDISSFDDFVNHNCKKVVFKGNFIETIPENKYLVMEVSNLWVEIKADGELVMSNRNSGISPGNSFHYLNASDVNERFIELTIENPYNRFTSMTPIENTLSKLGFGCKDIMYHQLLHNNTLGIVLCLAVCFLGLFAFTLAGMLWKNARNRNLCFALLAFISGLAALSDTVYEFLPLWITNPVLCMIIDEVIHILLPTVLFLYVTVTSENKIFKAIISSITLLSAIVTVVGATLQLLCVADLITFKFYIQPFFAAGLLISGAILILEAFKYKNKNAVYVFVSMTPLLLSLVADYVNYVMDFASGRTFVRLGLLVTVVISLIILLAEARHHAKESLRYEKMQYDMLQMQISVMTSQIQPHFLYNSLTSIAQLCEKDPAKAKTATIEFADYMRRNMRSLKEQSPVPFESELAHLKTYMSLEKMRFGEDLNVVYDINTTDFNIPSLTIQPLAENAVKHGVGMKEEGGTVRISTYEEKDYFIIEVTDNGVGFDSGKIYSEGKKHVGIANVRNRLKTMCGGTLEITSEINTGTKALVKIPKERD